MSHPANTQYPVSELVANRWSPRAFSDRDVTMAEIGSMLEAARWSASCFNEQPWRFIVGKRPSPAYDKILACLVPFNQGWAMKAPVLMLSVSSTLFSQNGKPNRHADYDTGQAAATLALQAMAMGLFVHQMGGFDGEAAAKSFGIPENHHVLAAFAVGHVGDPQTLDEGLRERELAPRTRKPLSELFFGNEWGTPFV